jgi:hypothetical protein
MTTWTGATENTNYVLPGYCNSGYVNPDWDLTDEKSAGSESTTTWTTQSDASDTWTAA